ncbi:MAG TPA: ABC transporter [Microbacterium sp.]|uniref:ABC transporter permease n=1 Tax=unclassified Microbacterium TaxID=2609290 RepID=UPI000C5DB4F6|nr:MULTISPECIES: ABC transporter permease [unclassified Microbacterium]MBU20545.1 ABC transporter [Microbacterium sp.]HBS08335.1 ABC transporter [Microbacterium sp.]HBU41491.1 ABC transporter [Microbacterium sp.]
MTTVQSGTGRRASRARMLAVWARQEVLLLLREPVAVFFSLAFPLVIYLFIGLPYANEQTDQGIRFIDFMFPTLIGTVSANLMLMGMPIYFAELRARGADRRYKVMPLPGWVFGVAIISATCVLLALAAAIIVAVVGIGHGLLLTSVSPKFIGLNVLLVAWLCAVGYFLGTLPLSTRTTQAVSAALFFVLFFGSGAAAPLGGLPTWIQDLMQFNPLRHWFEWLTAVYTSTPPAEGTIWKSLAVLPVAALAAWVGLQNSKRVVS